MTRLPTLGSRGEGWVVLQGVLLAGLGVAGLLGLAGTGGIFEAAWSGPARVATSVLGLGLAFVGANQVRLGARDLGANLTPLPSPSADAQLVETGSYAKVRHPIYGGIILGGVGWALLTAAPAALVLGSVPGSVLLAQVEHRGAMARAALCRLRRLPRSHAPLHRLARLNSRASSRSRRSSASRNGSVTSADSASRTESLGP